ncbi:unnamed protein product [Brachionus calyciflorus]|uniref:PDZ domain-containing protein n=1 Tax=Brachionus calyciflorus TaxID=104777 RepID=A0A813M3H1_9BILA|nr:unnamed protein product [Brachionus calyciflorus]
MDNIGTRFQNNLNKNNDENILKSNDQILRINGIYLNNDTSNIRLALSDLFLIKNLKSNEIDINKNHINNNKSNSNNNNNLIKLELLISRNISRKLIKKNLQLPEILFNKYLKSLSSSSSCSSLSILSGKYSSSSSSSTSSTTKGLDSIPTESKHKKDLLFYNLKNDSLRIRSFNQDRSSFSPTKENINQIQMTYKDMMVLNTEWTQLEIIDLLNELPKHNENNTENNTTQIGASSGSGGFGFGITGNKSTGVVVKVITPGGSAAKDGRLRGNDQIFQIGDINVRSMSSEQVAAVLRQPAFHGQYVKFLVARPVHNSVNDIELLNTNEIITLNEESPKKEIMNIKQPNSQNKCYLIKTSSIMDKKVDFKNLLTPEIIEENGEKSHEEIILDETLHENIPQNEPDHLENEQKSHELNDPNLYLIEIERKNKPNEFPNLLDYLNSEISNSFFSLDSVDDNYFIKNFDSKSIKFEKLDFYDLLIEINQFDLKSVNNEIITNMPNLILKFSKDLDLKFKLIRQKWLNFLIRESLDLGSYDLEIIISRIDKTKSKNLGISLEGTVDLDDNGQEKFPHHYIRSIMSNGPVDNSLDCKFKPGDELLEVNSIKLYAINYLELLEHLRSLGSKMVILVCARKLKKIFLPNKRAKSEGFLNSDSDIKIDSSSIESLSKELTKSTPNIIENISNENLLQKPIFNSGQKICVRSRSLELNGLALWSRNVNYFSLKKNDKGLGFSLIDYQSDPFNPLSKTMIVIRALVPGGVAHLDGRLMPGQRLVSINEIILDDDLIFKDNVKKSTSSINELKTALSHANVKTLDLLKYTVNVLKSLPIGQLVRLGVQKPLPYPDAEVSKSLPQQKIITSSNYDLEIKENENLDSEKNIIKFEDSDNEAFLENNLNLSDKKYEEFMKYGIVATSAPAILNELVNNDEKNNHHFYTSASQLKLNTLTHFSRVCSKSNLKLNLLDTNFSSDINDKLESLNNIKTSTPKMHNKELTKKESNYICINKTLPIMQFSAFKDEENENVDCFFDKNECHYLNNSSNFLNQLLCNQKQNEKNVPNLENDKQLLNEEQFNQAFILNANKKLKSWIRSNNIEEDYIIDQEILEIESNLNENNIVFLDQEIYDDTQSKKAKNSENITRMLHDMASFKWPTIQIDSISITGDKNEDLNKPVAKKKSKRKSRTFEEQNNYISKSRSPSGARTLRNFPDNSRYRSISQGNPNIHRIPNKKPVSSSRNSSLSTSVKIINILGKEIVKLPSYLEREIRIKKNFYPLGILSVDCFADEGINGCVVKKIDENSACARDNRLKVGDYLLSVNNEQMRILTNSSARAILNRASLTSKDVVIIYIPLDEAINFKSSVLKMERNKITISSSRSHGCIQSNNSHYSSRSSSTSSNKSSLSSSSNSSHFSLSSNSSLSSSNASLKNFDKEPDEQNTKNRLKSNDKKKSQNYLTASHDNKKKTTIECDSKYQKKRKIKKDELQLDQIETLTISLSKQEENNPEQTMLKSNDFNPNELNSNLWGQPRIIIIEREENKSLGISIVGGKLDVCTKSDDSSQINNFISGIFIKHVLENSPAGLSGTLKTGDRILAVNDIDLSPATHDKAVEVIRNAKSPVKFLIQSLICVDNLQSPNDENMIDKSKQIIDESNKYNYTLETMLEKYNYLLDSKENDSNDSNQRNKLFIYRLKRNFPNESLGLSLSGNVNLNKTSVFVCGIYPNSIAHTHGLIQIGDQILEINGQCLYGRAHSNVTPLIKNIKDLDVYLVVFRSVDNIQQMFRPNQNNMIHLNSSVNKNEVMTPLATSTNPSSSYRSSVSGDNYELKMSNSISNISMEKQSGNTTDKVVRKVELKKGSSGFGIAICEDKYGRLIIRGLNSNGIAFQDGRIQIGDEILAVNNIKVNTMKYDDVMNLLHSTKDPVEFQLSKPEILSSSLSNSSTIQSNHNSNINSSSPSNATSPQRIKKIGFLDLVNHQTKKEEKIKEKSNEINQEKNTNETENLKKNLIEQKACEKNTHNLNDEPKTNQIKVGEETWIEIDRGKLGLGLSIVGGSDTQLPGIIIHDIYQNGAAFKDRRLAIGDQLLKVNNIDLITATHDQALNALRQTSDTVKLLVHRGFTPDENSVPKSMNASFNSFCNYDDERYLNILIVDLNKKFGKGLGFSIIGRRNGSGVFISHIIEGGCAHKDGRLTIGDLILEVNGQDIRKSAYNDVAFLLKTLPQGKVTLKIGRFKTSANASNSNSVCASLNGSKTTSRRNSNSETTTIENIKSSRTNSFKPCIKK